MRARRLAVALSIWGAALVVATPASAVAPVATAWWNVANAGVVSPPAPPDVGPSDLLVQGGPPASGVEGAAPIHQAVAALRYALGAGGVPRQLVLELASSTPSGSVRACRVTSDFRTVRNGPWSDVPRHDCDEAVAGATTPDGSTLTFDDVSPLASGGRLSLILLPASPGRIVVRSPGAASLAVDRTADGEPPAADLGPPAELLPDESGVSPSFEPPPSSEAPQPPAAASRQEPAPPDRGESSSGPEPLRNRRARSEAGDFGARLLTAAVLFAALGPFVLLGQVRRRGRLPA